MTAESKKGINKEKRFQDIVLVLPKDDPDWINLLNERAQQYSTWENEAPETERLNSKRSYSKQILAYLLEYKVIRIPDLERVIKDERQESFNPSHFKRSVFTIREYTSHKNVIERVVQNFNS
jgi:hypothetical protein